MEERKKKHIRERHFVRGGSYTSNVNKHIRGSIYTWRGRGGSPLAAVGASHVPSDQAYRQDEIKQVKLEGKLEGRRVCEN